MLQLIPKSLWGQDRSRPCVPLKDGQTHCVSDTVWPGSFETIEASELITSLLWPRATFDVSVSHDCGPGDLSLAFPSPLPYGDDIWDRAVLDSYLARDRNGVTINGPAVLVLDILQGGNLVSGFIAKTFAKNGVHGFVLHMPQNGRRQRAGDTYDWSAFLPCLRQAVADARRARDVIAALPFVNGPIALQGTSLGGFVATIAASIDNAFGPVLLALTGGNAYDILSKGRADAARVRRELRDVGYDDERLRHWLLQMEPMRVAHRLDPRRTWLFSARFDQVVSAAHSRELAMEIGLDWQHHRQLAGCHYSCLVSAPRFLSEMVRAVTRPIPSPVLRRIGRPLVERSIARKTG